MTPAAFTKKDADPKRGRNRKMLIFGAATGLLYGFAVRLMNHFLPGALGDSFVMTAGFTCFLPFAMGFITVFIAEAGEAQTIRTWLLLPWAPLVAGLLATMLALLEGVICVVMFAPLGLVLASLGGLVGGVGGQRLRSQRSRNASLACVMVLPLLMATFEKPVLYHLELRTVETFADIQAPADVIWRNIERVPPIATNELPPSWSQRIGFPDPVEATLSYEGVGGIRNASFAGGVLFIETVDVWEPQRRLAFSIRAQTDRIPATTLDAHVRVGEPYFDVLRGEYRLEPLSNGKVRLHLSSQHRVSTDFNWYAHLWTDAVMADLQKRILYVVRTRCERAAAGRR